MNRKTTLQNLVVLSAARSCWNQRSVCRTPHPIVLMLMSNARRLDAVEDLMANGNFTASFDKMAKGLPDLERLISRIHAKTIKRSDLCVPSLPSCWRRADSLFIVVLAARSSRHSSNSPKVLRRSLRPPRTSNRKEFRDCSSLFPISPNCSRTSLGCTPTAMVSFSFRSLSWLLIACIAILPVDGASEAYEVSPASPYLSVHRADGLAVRLSKLPSPTSRKRCKRSSRNIRNRSSSSFLYPSSFSLTLRA